MEEILDNSTARACAVVNRRAFEEVLRVVNAQISGEVHNTVRGFYAPSGYGKSDFIDELWRYYRERPVQVSKVHVEDLVSGAGSTVFTDFVRKVAIDLGVDLDRAPTTREQIDKTLNLIDDATRQNRSTLLLIDDYDELPDDARERLEEDFLVPAVRGRKSLIILTSQHEIKFADRFFLRMRREFQQLTALDLNELRCEMPSYAELAPRILQLTGGLPTLVRVLTEVMDEQGIENAEAFERELDALRDVYYERALDVLFDDIEEQDRRTLFIISLLRGFDLDLMARILPEPQLEPIQLDVDQPWADLMAKSPDYEAVMDFLSKYGPWMQWRPEGRYMLHQAYRLVLQSYILDEDRGLFRLVHRTMLNYYRDALVERYQQAYALDLFYHRWWLIRLSYGATSVTPEQEPPVSVDELVLDLNGRALARVDMKAALKLYQALTKDPDLGDIYTHEELAEIIKQLLQARKEPVVWLPALEAAFSEN